MCKFILDCQLTFLFILCHCSTYIKLGKLQVSGYSMIEVKLINMVTLSLKMTV